VARAAACDQAAAKKGGLGVIRLLILVACGIAAVALLVATIGAVLAIITGHARWIEVAWVSIAASLLAIVLGELWPKDRNSAP
jgi:hypothetical protein